MLIVPGFSGYKAKEQRREADRLLRNRLYQRLQDARNSVQDAYQAATDRRLSDSATALDRLLAVFDRVSELVNHASYGYTGFFDAVKIEEDDLDRMLDFDMKLVDGVNALADRARALRDAARGGRYDESRKAAEELRRALEDFERNFSNRKSVIEGMEV